jgi:phage tail-like protein
MAQIEPLNKFRFLVEIDGIATAGFSEVYVGTSTTEIVEYREGSDQLTTVRKLSGLTKYGNIVLERGLDASMDLFNWYKSIVAGQIDANRRAVAIVVLGDDGTPRARFNIVRAWPTRYRIGKLEALGSGFLIEMVELANEGIERVS